MGPTRAKRPSSAPYGHSQRQNAPRHTTPATASRPTIPTVRADGSVKKRSIRASAVRLYDERKKPSMPEASMPQKAVNRKKASSRYLGRRSTRSSRAGTERARPRRCPSRPSRSPTKPTGQTWPQKALRMSHAMTSTARKMVSPAGWTGSQVPVARAWRAPSRALMGKKPSTPAGRAASGPPPAA